MNKIELMLSKMTSDLYKNSEIIKSTFGNLYYKEDDKKTLLHILVDEKYNEQSVMLAIKSLLKAGLSPNAVDEFKYNFIQVALYTGYSERFILDIINESLKYNLNVNHVDKDKDTMMHTAIYSDDYNGDIINIYNLLCKNRFDSSKLDKDKRNLVDAMEYQRRTQGQYTIEQINNFSETFNNNYDNTLGEIIKRYGSLNHKDNSGQTLLHIVVDKKMDESKCLRYVKSLLKEGLNPNAKDDFKYNFIQTALYAGYSEIFILDIIKEALKYNLNVNHKDDDYDTIMHTAIYSDYYTGDIISIYNLLCENGFKSEARDKCERNILDAMIFQKYPSNKIKQFKEIFMTKVDINEIKYDANINEILKKYKSLDYKDGEDQTLLHIIVDKKMDESKCLNYVKSLLKAGLNPNAKTYFGYNFIQVALYTGYSEKFILNIIREALKYNLDINHVDKDQDTIMHTAIYSDDYKGELINIYNLLCENGFDSKKEDKEGRNLVEAMIYQRYPSEKVKQFKKIFIESIKKEEIKTENTSNNNTDNSKFKSLRKIFRIKRK